MKNLKTHGTGIGGRKISKENRKHKPQRVTLKKRMCNRKHQKPPLKQDYIQ